jgi:hypothetical protein
MFNILLTALATLLEQLSQFLNYKLRIFSLIGSNYRTFFYFCTVFIRIMFFCFINIYNLKI